MLMLLMDDNIIDILKEFSIYSVINLCEISKELFNKLQYLFTVNPDYLFELVKYDSQIINHILFKNIYQKNLKIVKYLEILNSKYLSDKKINNICLQLSDHELYSTQNIYNDSYIQNKRVIFKMFEKYEQYNFPLNWMNYQYWDDESFVKKIVSIEPYTFYNASYRLQQKYDLCLYVLNIDPDLFQYCSSKIRNNIYFVITCLRNKYNIIHWVHNELKDLINRLLDLYLEFNFRDKRYNFIPNYKKRVLVLENSVEFESFIYFIDDLWLYQDNNNTPYTHYKKLDDIYETKQKDINQIVQKLNYYLLTSLNIN